MEILSDFPLFKLNTFGIRAYAKEFIEIRDEQELVELFADRKLGSKQILFLGGGSNILFTGDYTGIVIKISTAGKSIVREDDKKISLKVAAGENWDGLVEFCADKGWGGLENLSGIPGQVGSSPIQNIGAYGSELKDHFESLEGINLCTGERFIYDSERCQFGYRDSIFKRALKGRVVITSVTYCLDKKPAFNLSYKTLNQQLSHFAPEDLTLKGIRDTVLQIRASKLPDPKVTGNAGSFFKNPLVSIKQFEELKKMFPEIVYFEVPAAGFKLAAGWLIEQCGWKGFREGDAGVHKDQALVLVNYGSATGMQIMELAGRIQRSVRDKFGVLLEREVNVV